MSFRIISMGFAATLAAASPALGDMLADRIAAMPGNVEHVSIAGTWQDDGNSGTYRVVVARTGADAVTARLFVQWISYDEAGESRIEESVEITEFAPLGLDIVDFTSESDSDGLSMYIETIDPSGSLDEQYELHIFAPDDYRFGPVSN